tara:strand:+ start:3692 stop:4981 length:1290 start_codon:yes stop_codon:yes gene_type:complete
VNIVSRSFFWTRDHYLLGLSILVIAIMLASFIFVTRPKAAPRVIEEKAWLVSTIVSKPASVAPNLTVFGKVESRQVANLKTSIIAPVAEVFAYEGQWVNEGDLLVQLATKELDLALGLAKSEHEQQQAVLRSVKNDFDLATQLTQHYQDLKKISDAKLQRHLNLFSNKMVSDAIVDEVRQQASQQAIVLARHLSRINDFPNQIGRQQALVDQSKANLDKAYLDLAQAEIESPFSGRVLQTFVASGDRILPGVPVIQVADSDGMEVRASVSTGIGVQLRSHMKESATIKASGIIDDNEISFTLSRLSGDVKVGQSGLDAFFTPDQDDMLDIGRVVSLSITLPEVHNVVILPMQSIYENHRIYRVEANRLVGINVEQVGDYVNEQDQYRLLVRSKELAEGDRIVTTQLPRAITGLLVEPIDSSEFTNVLAL